MARPSDPSHLSDLAFARFNHYKATGDVNSLVEAVQMYRQCVGVTAPFDDDLPTRQFFLLISLRALHDETRQLDLLREAIMVGTAAARTMSPQRVGYTSGALNLAVALRDYASLAHDVTSVDPLRLPLACRSERSVVQHTPPGRSRIRAAYDV